MPSLLRESVEMVIGMLIVVLVALVFLLGIASVVQRASDPSSDSNIVRTIQQAELYRHKTCTVTRLLVRDSLGATVLYLVEGAVKNGRSDYPKCRLVLP